MELRARCLDAGGKAYGWVALPLNVACTTFGGQLAGPSGGVAVLLREDSLVGGRRDVAAWQR